MQLAVGDRLIVHSRHVTDLEGRGEVVEVLGPDGREPYVISWEPEGHRGLLFPGPDIAVLSVLR